jgi:hypothetical protein
MPDYQGLTDDEVLQIATEREQLTDDARTVLESELARRRLSIKDVHSHKIAYEHAQKLEQSRTQHKILSRRSYDRSGIGFKFLGKRNFRRDPSGQSEEYESTRWFVVLWIPVFPIGTFTVRRTILRRMGIPFKSDPQIIERHPRNWEQILLTWVKTAAVLMVLRLAYLFLVFHAEWLRRILK